DIAMYVLRPQADPVHRRQVTDRVALMRVQHELRSRRRARSEVKKERIIHPRVRIRCKLRRFVVGVVVILPAANRLADGDSAELRSQILELLYYRAGRNYMPSVCTLHAVP